MKKKNIPFIGYASGIAAGNVGCGDGPSTLQKSDFAKQLEEKNITIEWIDVLYPDFSQPILPTVTDLCFRLAQHTAEFTRQKQVFTILGGDHSCAIGTWSGVASTLRHEGPIGLVWIDAHMDSHTPETSESGNIHGMPLATLLGFGAPTLVQLMTQSPKIRPEHVSLIGIRSFEPAEVKLVERLGVRVYYMDEIKERGIAIVLQEALARAQQGTVGYGMSIDVDGLDPLDAPGVGTPVINGIRCQDLCNALSIIRDDSRLLGVEIVEFNPHCDENRRTEATIREMVTSIF
jgi:arginase